jgi:flagellar biosynthetic protein FliP
MPVSQMTQAANLIENQSLAPSLKVLLLLTLLGLLPALILTATSFLRTVVVLSFLRIGLGTAQTPPNQVMIGIALFLTLFTMSPVISQIKDVAYEPYQRGELTEIQAIERGIVPVKRFMLRQTREEDLRMFHAATNTPIPQTPDEVSIMMALPAFAISELTTGFQMGVVILLPFLVVDLAVASLLMSMGMIMVPPATLSLPIKLLLFVLVDGWNLVTGSILRSFL